jgi:hypothetical protein
LHNIFTPEIYPLFVSLGNKLTYLYVSNVKSCGLGIYPAARGYFKDLLFFVAWALLT